MTLKLDKALLSHKFQVATGCKPEKAMALTQAYINLCTRQIFLHLNKSTGNEYVHISLNDCRRGLGDITVKGKRYYVWNEFQNIPERLVVPIALGNNIKGQLTMAATNYLLEEMLIATDDHKGLSELLYGEYAGLPSDMIPIDMFSLNSFIAGNKDITERTPRINNYLYHALRIKLIAEANNGMMPHIISESQFGRKYYLGPNLQNTPKRVRLAALGSCHEYDIESSVFAWKMNEIYRMAKDDEMSISLPATLEYLDYKKAKREYLAQVVFGSTEVGFVNIIKQAITAIGFGAPARTSGYVVNGKYEPSALNSIITSQTKLTAFLNDPWMKEFIKEQKTMNDIIIQWAKVKGLIPELKKIPDLVDGAGRLRPNSAISYLYQQNERTLLRFLEEQCAPSEVLLTVHDCIYTRRPVKLVRIREELQYFGQFYKVSHEEHQGYAYDHELLAHRARIAEEEIIAGADPRIQSAWRNVNNTKTLMQIAVRDSGSTDHYTGSNYSDCNYDRDSDPFYNEEE